MATYALMSISDDTTKILPCRDGDILVWIYDKADLFDPKIQLNIADLWVTTDGEFAVFTNRIEDVPKGYPLVPTLMGGRNVSKMADKPFKGFEVPHFDLDGVNDIWKVNVHHYIIWSGERRNDLDYVDGILGIFRFEAGSLALIQNREYTSMDLYGNTSSPVESYLTDKRAREIRRAIDFIETLGKQRNYVEKWTLG